MSTPPTAIRIVLADDHPLVRAGIRTTLLAAPDLLLVGEADNGFATQHLCQELLPDVLLLDLNMPGPPPRETLAFLHMHCPSVRVLVLTAYDDDAYVRGMISAGVAGYLLKDDAIESVVQAIRSIAQGHAWFSPGVIARLARQQPEGLQRLPQPAFTEQERRLLSAIAQGWDNTRMAEELCLAEQTVRNYVSRLYTKIGVSTRAEAVIWAREHGMMQQNP